jgi:hypothetical protein
MRLELVAGVQLHAEDAVAVETSGTLVAGGCTISRAAGGGPFSEARMDGEPATRSGNPWLDRETIVALYLRGEISADTATAGLLVLDKLARARGDLGGPAVDAGPEPER